MYINWTILTTLSHAVEHNYSLTIWTHPHSSNSVGCSLGPSTCHLCALLFVFRRIDCYRFDAPMSCHVTLEERSNAMVDWQTQTQTQTQTDRQTDRLYNARGQGAPITPSETARPAALLLFCHYANLCTVYVFQLVDFSLATANLMKIHTLDFETV